MKSPRITYSVIIPCIIVAGLLVRLKRDWFPPIINLYLGDVLYAVMVFYMVSIAFPFKPGVIRAVCALAFCFGIEFLQLYTAPWIMAVRNTRPGGLVLGHGFLWSDILAYSVGVAVAYCADRIWLSHKKSVADSRLK